MRAHPNLATTMDGNGISTPDVLRIHVRETNILDDDVGSANDPQTLAFAEEQGN